MITIKCDRCGKTAINKDTREFKNLYYYNMEAPNMDLCKNCQDDYKEYKKLCYEKMSNLEIKHEQDKIYLIDSLNKEFLNRSKNENNNR